MIIYLLYFLGAGAFVEGQACSLGSQRICDCTAAIEVYRWIIFAIDNYMSGC